MRSFIPSFVMLPTTLSSSPSCRRTYTPLELPTGMGRATGAAGSGTTRGPAESFVVATRKVSPSSSIENWSNTDPSTSPAAAGGPERAGEVEGVSRRVGRSREAGDGRRGERPGCVVGDVQHGHRRHVLAA